MSLDTATENLPDVEGFLDQHEDQHTGQPDAESKAAGKKSRPKPSAKTPAKAAAATAITPEIVREVLEVRGALELSTDGARALLESTLKAEDGLDELTAAVLCSTGSAGFLTTLQELRAKVTSVDPAAAFAAAVEILTMDKAERSNLWTFAHERGLVEAKRVPANESKAATDLAEALKNLPETEMADIAAAVALLER